MNENNVKNVGMIQYTVVADTAQLLKAAQDAKLAAAKIDESLKSVGSSSPHIDKVTKSIEDLGKEAKSSGAALTGIQKTLLGLATIGTAASLAKMADDYRAMGERVLGATESLEEYDLVQGRLLESANKTFRPLAEAQELFISTSGNIRDYGYSLEEALDITDSMSYGFVRNAASADKAQSAIRAYDASLSTGKVNAMQWLSISGAIDTLAIDMAEQMGLTAREIDKLGFSGQITAEMLNDALLKAFKANKDGADAMKNTVEDAFVSMRNNLSVYVGELNKSTGATDMVAKSIIYLSENISTLAILLGAAGAGAIAKYVTRVGTLTVAKMKSVMATRADNAEELRSAKIALDKARADVARTAALTAKVSGTHAHTRALGAEALAIARVTTAQKAMDATTRGFMSILGGPAGIVGLLTMGVAAFSMFTSSVEDANIEITQLKKPIEDLTKEIENMTNAQREAALVTYEKEQKQAVKDLEKAYAELYSEIDKAVRRNNRGGGMSHESYLELNEALKEAKETGSDLLPIIEKLSKKYGIPKEDLDSLIQLNGGLSTAIQTAESATAAFDKLRNVIAGIAAESAELRKQTREQGAVIENLSSVNKSLQEQMGRITDKGSALNKYMREHGNEIQKQIDSGAELNEVIVTQHNENIKLATAIDEESKARRTSNKEINQSAQVLKDLQNELHLATLSGKELAIVRAEQRLNEFATEQEIQAVRNLASAIYDLNEAKKFGETDQEIVATITGQVNPLTGGAFDDQVARYEAEMVAEQARYDAQLERLRNARELQLLAQEEFNDLEYNLQQTHADRMAQIEQAKSQVILNSFGSAFDAMAGIMEKAHGDQSTAYKAMFALSQGFALAEAGLNISKALSQVLADPSAMTTAQKLANYGMIATEGTKILSSIGNIAYGGGRQYGGPVAANKMYRVNETGQPEIFNAANGQQFLLPNQKGSVTPAGKGGGTVSLNPTFTINIDVPTGMDTQEIANLTVQVANNQFKKLVREEFRPGGVFYRR